MSTLPGSVGWPITGDKTIEFAKNPNEFIHSRINSYGSRVFQTRALNRPHVFVASSQGVKEIFQDQAHALDMGYKDFGYMYSLFGDLVIFNTDDEAVRLRKVLCSCLKPENMSKHLCEVDMICSRLLDSLHEEPAVPLYRTLKLLTTEISLTLFLGLDFESASHEAEDIIDLTIAHWRGLISIPLNINIYGQKSGYSKAMAAKKRLLEIITKKVGSNNLSEGSVFQILKEAEFESTKELTNHLLLFVSALVPKALASLLVSFCLELSKSHNFERRQKAATDDNYLDDVLLEVTRLWPPFLGGRRKAKKEVIIDGYRIPEGYYVAYLTRAANCDPKVFPEPYQFNPERWQTCNLKDRDLVWTFGSGPRVCVGHSFIYRIIKLIAKFLLHRYEWSLPQGQDLKYKWLPVSRPKADVHAVFTPKPDSSY
ncbi:uncharacterized protein LOC116291258 [Actinia tenebrosa]|uniref:Uncharacterized protein LOC116291258 n=1 Tax=Actinia tenebrosa TaxID=6105 RepID=A0A6P8HCW0_ACTTE|nr:uncharacterized protein LOC116291258 [Actinia tenebrosa]